MGKNSKEKFGEHLAKVEGKSKADDSNVHFRLRIEEIKHIRRCISHYDRTFAKLYPRIPKDDKSLSVRIYSKFSQFGKLRHGLRVEQKAGRIEDMKKICSFPGCTETENLTIDHIKKASSLPKEEANKKENLQLFCPKHHLLKELNDLLWHKKIEMDRLRERINQIEELGTTDCLGYKVLSKNKFVKMDLDIGEELYG
jgi:hypothetical protein